VSVGSAVGEFSCPQILLFLLHFSYFIDSQCSPYSL